MMDAQVWYCGRCRKVIKSKPHVMARGCKCETPVVPIAPTRVIKD